MEKLNKVFRTAQLAAIDKYTFDGTGCRDMDRSFFENFH